MLFNFNFCNDFGEKAEGCCCCGIDTRERFDLSFRGVRITVWACRACRFDASQPFWLIHEWLQRSVYAARDAEEAGEPVAEYQNAYDFGFSGNGQRPLTKNRTQKNGPKTAIKR